MKRLIIIILLTSMTSSLTLFAQSEDAPSQMLSELKTNFISATDKKIIKGAALQLDEFLSHVKIEKDTSTAHNMIPCICCYYDSMPLSTSAILRIGTKNDTIQFYNGLWCSSEEFPSGMEVDLLCFENALGNNNVTKKTLETLRKKHRYKMNENQPGTRKMLFFVKEENLFYAAIESRKIPAFTTISDNKTINYASCLNTILKASGVEVTCDEIIKQYLKTKENKQLDSTKSYISVIKGRNIVTTFIPQNEIDVMTLINELIRERFMIAIDKDGNVGLLTAIALSRNMNDFQPAHVRLRAPILSIDNQRIQKSWNDFYEHLDTLVKVDIY